MDKNFKVGDILLSKWGYEQINNSFYQIFKVSASYVYLLEVKLAIKARKGSSGLDELRLYDANDLTSCGHQGFKRKISKDGYIKINSYEYARKFDDNEWVYCSWCN